MFFELYDNILVKNLSVVKCFIKVYKRMGVFRIMNFYCYDIFLFYNYIVVYVMEIE